MTVTCRLLTRRDAAVLGNATEGVFDRVVDPALAEEFLSDERHHIAGAILDGRLVGFASAVHYVHPDKPAQLFINEVGVSPAHRRSGLGKRLLDVLLEQGRRLGCSEAWVLTDPGNEAANALYRAMGGAVGDLPQLMYTFDFSGSEAPPA